jgi:peptidylprolyl isomerase
LRAFAVLSASPLIALNILLSACGGATSGAGSAAIGQTDAQPSSGLQITDVKTGTGFSPKAGQTCVVHYTGWLYENGAKGKKFDSSLDRKTPFSFVLGEHKVIDGWERGVGTMKPGGKRTLIIPPELGYGSSGSGAAIPPNATLIFEIELLQVKAGR